MTEPKHSELPWKPTVLDSGFWCDPGGKIINANSPDNAEFIVRACNSHYELVEALEKLQPKQELLCNENGNLAHQDVCNWDWWEENGNALLKKAKGETQ